MDDWEEVIADWHATSLEEVSFETLAENPLRRLKVNSVEFVSKSKGYNRPRKYATEILLVTHNKKTYLIGNKLTKKIQHLLEDIYPEYLAADSPYDWLTSFKHALRELNRLAKK